MEDYQLIIKKIQPELDKAINFLEKELIKIRTGRATPALVEDIIVECFGQKFVLKQLAAIFAPEAKQLLIQPWDKSYLGDIIRALEKTDLGVAPIVDKEVIRINLPALSEDYRKNLAKLITEKSELARETIRKWRESAWKEIQEKTRQGEIREDDKFRAKDDLQKLVDEYNKKIEQIVEKKKKEIEI
ncbi:MAG: ribosome recycling factor [Minisyncoccales bacterium]